MAQDAVAHGHIEANPAAVEPEVADVSILFADFGRADGEEIHARLQAEGAVAAEALVLPPAAHHLRHISEAHDIHADKALEETGGVDVESLPVHVLVRHFREMKREKK